MAAAVGQYFIKKLPSETGAKAAWVIGKRISAETATSAAESIQRQTGEEGFSLEDVLCTDGMEEKLLEKLALREALRHLGEKERLVIQLRYYHSLTQQRVAELIGVSQVQVSRIEKKALERLRTFF